MANPTAPSARPTTLPGDEPAFARPWPVRWLAARPRIGDIAVILATAMPTLIALVLAPPAHAWLGYLCAAGVAAAFWWRRTHPLAVLLIVVALATLNPVSGRSMSPALAESAFALYAMASYTRLRTAILGYALSQGIVAAGSGLAIWLGFRGSWPVVLFQPVALVALALGIAARASRARYAAIEELMVLREERAAAAERTRITAEMHDVVAHSVTVMVALAGGARAGWESHPERARRALEQLGTVGAQTLQEMQRILRVLRERDADLGKNLENSGHNLPSLSELVAVFRDAGLPVTLTIDPACAIGHIPPADPALQTTVYRIVQESLTNVLRHARDVTHVEVEVADDGQHLAVSVTDNGRGATPGPGGGAGMGLHAMRERAAAFHGQFTAGPIPTSDEAPGTGWRTYVSIPVGAGAR